MEIMRKQKIIASLLIPLLCLLGVWFYFSKDKVVEISAIESENLNKNNIGELENKTINIGGYTICLEYLNKNKEEDNFGDFLKLSISKNNKKIFETDPSLYFSNFFNAFNESEDIVIVKSASEIKDGLVKDVNNNGIPELVFSAYSGGSHCCNHNYVIELIDPLNFILDANTEDAGMVFKDINKDGVYEIETYDTVFNYWNTSYVASPRPNIILSIKNGIYRVDTELMKRPAPTNDELISKAKFVMGWGEILGKDDKMAWDYALELIYSGNLKSAQKYVDLSWGSKSPNEIIGEFKSKEDFWNELIKQTKTSSYYQDLTGLFGF